MSFPSLPPHLDTRKAQGLRPDQPIAQYEIGNLSNFVYLILDWDRRKAGIVDPQTDLSTPLGDLERHGFELTSILLTHTHFDHVAGVPGLLKKFPSLPVHVHPADAFRLKSKVPQTSLRTVGDCERVPIGGIEVELIHTPGHSAGECCYFVSTGSSSYLLSGDTVFIRDCGRTDLETGSDEEMFASLQKLKTLPPGSILLPGHHYAPECASTLARELVESPPFRCRSVGELRELP